MISRLSDVDSGKCHWDVVEHRGAKWIEARSHDEKGEVTEAHRALVKMSDDVSSYPLLDEHQYCESEYNLIVQALVRVADRTGTIINSYRELVACLFDNQIEVIEDEPMVYRLVMSDEDFVKFIGEIKDEK